MEIMGGSITACGLRGPLGGRGCRSGVKLPLGAGHGDLRWISM